MPKVLLVGESPTHIQWGHLIQTLRNFGIEVAQAYATSKNADVQTPAGAFASGSPDLRNYFRTYDAVFVVERQPWIYQDGVRAAVRWLGWNNPEDTPIVYFGYNLSTYVNEHNGELPSGFPLIRINPTNLANTAALADGGAALAYNIFSRHGTPITLLRENATLYTPTVCAWATSGGNAQFAYWRYNPTLHSALASQTYTHRVAPNERAGEVLAVPANLPPDGDTYPTNTAVAYRYYNRFFLPAVSRGGYQPVQPIVPQGRPVHDVFWLIYALKLCGILPAWRVPLQFETDHPLQLETSIPSLTEYDRMRIKRDVYDWWRGFCRQTGLVVINGVQVGSRDRSLLSSFHWRLINYPNPDVRAVAQQTHQILVAGHREGTLPCGVHDHSINDTRGWGARSEMPNFKRHINPNSRYGAPNDVPIRHGACCIAKHVAPNGIPSSAIETTIGSDTFYEWDFTGRTSGTEQTINPMPMQNIHAARVVIESEIDEMLAMGFPDGHCGEHRYTNTAANNSGGIAYWQAAKEMGFRALRSSYCVNEHFTPSTPGARNQTASLNYIWEGLHLIPHSGLDISTTSATWGLYDPSSPSNGDAVKLFELDSTDNDITGQWSTNRHAAAWRAHRRALCRLTGDWLSINVTHLGAAYMHPVACWYGCNPDTPVARFDSENILNANGQPHWNPTMELMENMRVIVRVLNDYLQFGSVSDLIAVRERVMG